MIEANGKKHPTISDVTGRDNRRGFGVSPKAVSEWIERGIIDPPPTIQVGLRKINYFPHEYMKKARLKIKNYRKQSKT